jgi:fumarate hydratase class II
MQSNPAGRVRVLADSVGSLAIEIRAATGIVNQRSKVQLDATNATEVKRAVAALETLVKELASVNQNIAKMAQQARGGFLVSMIAGNAEAELERLKAKVDELRSAFTALVRAIKG